MLSSYLILCCHLLLLPSVFPIIRILYNESALIQRCSKIFFTQVSIQPKTMNSHCLKTWNHIQNSSLFSPVLVTSFLSSLFPRRNHCFHQSNIFIVHLFTNVDWTLRMVHSVGTIYKTHCKHFCFLILFKTTLVLDLPFTPGFHRRLRSSLISFFKAIWAAPGFWLPHLLWPLFSPISCYSFSFPLLCPCV